MDLNREIEYIRSDIRAMGDKLDQVMAFMALMQGADIEKRLENVIEHEIRPLKNKVESLEMFVSKLIGIYLSLGGLLVLINMVISIIALFK